MKKEGYVKCTNFEEYEESLTIGKVYAYEHIDEDGDYYVNDDDGFGYVILASEGIEVDQDGNPL